MIQDLKSLLIGFLGEEKASSSVLRYGLSLAQQAQAHASICALAPTMAVTHAFISSLAEGLIIEENQRLRHVAEAAAEEARQGALAQGIPNMAESVQDSYPVLSGRFARRARPHDLTLFNAQPDPMSLGRGILEEVLFTGGSPVIVVPAGTDSFKAETIIVAWDGSASAARAVKDALPFLKAARQVEVVSVQGEKDLSNSIPGAELAPHLSRHGIACTVKDLSTQNGDVCGTLLSQASLIHADMIVMGAFVHSRLRQLVLGGVTRSILNSSKIPLLLSH